MQRCFQSVKVKKFESNSQPSVRVESEPFSCFQSVKVKKFESNSQLVLDKRLALNSCFQSVKVKKFESNSQLMYALVPVATMLFSECQS